MPKTLSYYAAKLLKTSHTNSFIPVINENILQTFEIFSKQDKFILIYSDIYNKNT